MKSARRRVRPFNSKKCGSLKIAALTVAIFCFVHPLAYAQTTPESTSVRSFDIPVQPLTTALREFARQSGQEILFSPEVAAQKTTDGIRGTLPPLEALGALLKNTGINFSTTSNGAILLRNNDAQAVKAAPTGLTTPTLVDSAIPAEVTELDTIVVTGTNIRGIQPVGTRPLVYDRTDIRNTGASTLQDFLQTVPQNFGATELAGGVGNFTRATAPNLRGLGKGTTLVLVNGRRQPGGGISGDIVDVASIATSAIERVEILTDGASAIYGADAVGGVINIILRNNFDGAETTLKYGTAGGEADELQASQFAGRRWATGSVLGGYQYYHRDALPRASRYFSDSAGLRRRGGFDYRDSFSNPGNILAPDGSVAFAIPGGQDGTSLTVNELIPGVQNFGDPGEKTDLLQETTSHTAFGLLRQEIFENAEIFAEGRYSRREFAANARPRTATLLVPSTNPYYLNPFGGTDPVRVAYSFIDDLGPGRSDGYAETYASTIGVDVDATNDWRVSISGSYGQDRTHARIDQLDNEAISLALADPTPATAFNPFGSGSNTNSEILQTFLADQVEDYRMQVSYADAIAAGPTFSIGDDASHLAVGIHYRNESLRQSESAPDLGRDVSAIFSELVVPLLSSGAVRQTQPLIEASFAARYEQYSDFGGATSPKFGVNIRPAKGLTIRASWGESFRPPNLSDLAAAQSVYVFPLPDPRSPSGVSPVLFRSGGNSKLKEESSTSWSTGFDIQGDWLGVSNLSVTYYNIDYKDRVVTPSSSALQQEEIWADVINRQPLATDLKSLCLLVRFGSCEATPPAVILDARVQNASVLRTDGIDLQLNHTRSVWGGEVTAALNANYVITFQQALTSRAPAVEIANVVGNPIDLRLRAALIWRNDRWTLSTAANYANSYWDNVGAMRREVGSSFTVDTGLQYRFGSESMNHGFELSLQVINILNREPPFVNAFFGFDTSNATPLGRRISVELRKNW